jgi:hypothetical protein
MVDPHNLALKEWDQIEDLHCDNWYHFIDTVLVGTCFGVKGKKLAIFMGINMGGNIPNFK